jgi:hypothetical protein
MAEGSRKKDHFAPGILVNLDDVRGICVTINQSIDRSIDRSINRSVNLCIIDVRFVVVVETF